MSRIMISLSARAARPTAKKRPSGATKGGPASKILMTNKLLGAMTLMALSLSDGDHEHDFKKLGLSAKFLELANAGKPLLKAWGLLKPFAISFNIFKKEGWRYDEENASDFAKALGRAMPRIKADVDNVNASQLTYLTKLRTYFNKDSAPAWRHLIQNVSKLGIPGFATHFVGHVEEVSEPVDTKSINVVKMKEMVKKMTGRSDDPIMAPLEVSQYMEKFPKGVAIYRKLYAAFNRAFRIALKTYIRSQGKDKLPVHEVSKYMAAKGIDNTPTGFKGYVDEDGKYYTVKGHLINGVVSGAVKMNPSYDPAKDNTYVCKAVFTKGKQGRLQEWRTIHFNHNKALDRHEVVKETAGIIKGLRVKWGADLTDGTPKIQSLAAMVETAYTTLARVGGVDNKDKDGNTTYGLSTLLVKHLKIDKAGAHFDYAGKKGTAQPATLYPRDPIMRKAIAVHTRLVRGKKPTDHVYTYNGKRLTAQSANAYMKTLGFPAGFTIHKFRHLAGTKMYLDIVKTSPFKKGDPKTSQSAVEKWYKEAMVPIGKALHHRTGEKVTGMTAIGAYISLEPQRDFFKRLGLREPTFLARKKA